MDNSTLLFWGVVWVISAFVCGRLYSRKGYKNSEGFVMGLVFGVFAIAYAAFFLKSNQKVQE